MNIPPTKRHEKIEKIHQASKILSMQEIFSSSSKFITKYPVGGYSLKELNSKLDKQLDYMLMNLDEYQEYYYKLKVKEHPFNQSNASADLEWWAKKPYWQLDEAIALLFDKNPNIVNWEAVKQADEQIVPIVKEYKKIRELGEQYKEVGTLPDKICPKLFLVWADKMKLKINPELIRQVAAIHIEEELYNSFISLGIQEPTIAPEKEKTESTLLKLTVEEFMPNFTKKPDHIAQAIHTTVCTFIKNTNSYPTEFQTWEALLKNPPQGFIINAGKRGAIKIEGKEIDQKAFKKRWNRYTSPK